MRLLVVEDEPKIASAVAKLLRQEGYAVDVEHDGDGAYAMASTVPYDLLVVDRMIPGSLDGIELIKRLRSDGVSAPALILTALSSVKQKTEGLDAGGDDYLTKPFSIDELLARIRALLRRPKIQQGTSLTAGQLSLNTTTQEVRYGQNVIELTSTEYALLRFLLSNKGTTLSKAKLIEHVWDFDADILPNTVEAYIKYLRQKIDIPYKTKLIVTVRGFGYKIMEPNE